MKAYILLCDGFEEVEALTTVDVLRRAGIEAVTVSAYGENPVMGAHGIKVTADMTFINSDTLLDNFLDGDAVVLPGGMPGTKHLGASNAVIKMITTYAAKGKTVAAVCAAPSVLAAAGLLKDREVTCFPGFEKSLGGGIYVNAPAVISGNIVTGKSMGCAIDFALGIVENLLGIDKAEEVEEKLVRK